MSHYCRHSSILRSAAFLFAALAFFGCSSSGSGLLGPPDETQKAVELVAEANSELRKIRVLYKNNEGKREELKTALGSDSLAEVEKITNDIVQIINEGTDLGTSAVDKLVDAQNLNIGTEFKEYLRLKEESIRKQLEAFENYRQAARSLRDNYDPKNPLQKTKVENIFNERSEAYRKIMEDARDYSSQANELYKETLQKQNK